MAALRWSVALAIALLGVGFVAWRSGDRTPLDEVAIAEARLGIDLESRRIGAFVELPEASHWLLLEEPERIGELMVEFFSAGARP